MDKIIYIRKVSRAESYNVFLEGKIVGTIKKEKGGYQYTPKGCTKKYAGELYITLEGVKRSLEGEE
jgi:hypothetical protein